MSRQKKLARLHENLSALGFTYREIEILRLAELTLHRWCERECNGEIELDEKTGRYFARRGDYVEANDPRRIRFVPNREAGALRRIEAVMAERITRGPDDLVYYYQTDPRGCALYIVRKSDIPEGGKLDAYYTRGVAVCL